jgi:hypothetical protein
MKKFIYLLVLFSFSINISCFRDKTPEEIEKIISNSEALKRVNKLCLEIPKPSSFDFVKKGLGGNTGTASVIFYFLSYTEPNKIREFYKNWAREDGWQLFEGNQFIKGDQTVVLEFEHINNSNVIISCNESL